MSYLEIFILCWIVGIICFLAGAAWVGLFRSETEGQKRVMRHVRESDEHAIDLPENSKIKAPDDWPRGGI